MRRERGATVGLGIRIDPDIMRRVRVNAMRCGLTIREFVSSAIEKYIKAKENAHATGLMGDTEGETQEVET